ncbi:MAG: YdcF family protein [Spirochaetia bacterium]|nr:YdcF family protein [Spirochaetia bacterium]
MKKSYLLLSIPFVWFLVHTAAISIYGLKDNSEQADFAVVLGNTVNPDGSPSERLKGRLDKAAELFHHDKVKIILVSGGTGLEGHDEAQVMKEYLIAKNIPKNNIYMDSKGNNTMLSARNSYNFSTENNFKSVIIVSQFFHLARSLLIFMKSGFSEDQIYSAHADYFELRDFYSLFREFFAFYYYLLFR